MSGERITTKRIALITLAIAQAATPALLLAAGFERHNLGANTPIVPVDFTFIIWAFIHGASLVWAGWHLFAREGGGALFQWIAVPVGVAFALNVLWLLAAHFGLLTATAPILLLTLALLGHALIVSAALVPTIARAERLLTLAMLGPQVGWLTIVAFANITEVAAARGFSFFGLSLETWTVLVLVLAAALACAIAWAARGPWGHAIAVGWALLGIFVANLGADRVLIQATCGLAVLAVLITTLAARSAAADEQRSP